MSDPSSQRHWGTGAVALTVQTSLDTLTSVMPEALMEQQGGPPGTFI